MTVTVNGSTTKLTDGHVSPDVHVRVRRPKTGPEGLSGPDPGGFSVRARAIPRDLARRQLSDARNFVSLQVEDAKNAVSCGWLASEQPQPLTVTWRQVLPAAGEAASKAVWCGMAAAGLVRALFHTVGFLLYFSTATRMRAAVIGVIFLLLLSIYTAGQIVG